MKTSKRHDENPEGRMPLIEHIRELRRRLIWSVLALIIAMTVAYIFYDPIWDFLKDPYMRLPPDKRGHGNLITTGVFEGFFLKLKIAFIAGMVLASPVWLYQIWAFVTPGLYKNERRYTLSFISIAVPLFLAGAALAYFVMQKGLEILIGFVPEDATAFITLKDYLNYVITLMLVFGVSFELPLIMVFLNIIGVLSHERIKKSRRYIILGLVLFAAIVTPTPDPFNMLVLACPMVVLFGVAEVIIFFNDKRRARRRGADDELSDDEASPLDLDEFDADDLEDEESPKPG